jgi:hypothetical protein
MIDREVYAGNQASALQLCMIVFLLVLRNTSMCSASIVTATSFEKTSKIFSKYLVIFTHVIIIYGNGEIYTASRGKTNRDSFSLSYHSLFLIEYDLGNH